MLGKEINIQVIQMHNLPEFRIQICNELHNALADCEIISIEYSTMNLVNPSSRGDTVYYSAMILYKGTRVEGPMIGLRPSKRKKER